ncbi:hypothetical protein Tco_0016805 [Tanacetum coccineum]
MVGMEMQKLLRMELGLKLYCWAKVSTARQKLVLPGLLTTASVNITTAEPITPPTTTTVFEDNDLIISQTLMKMRSEKSKVRGVVMQEPSETATRPTVPPQQHDPKDKGKGKMVEQEKPLKKKDQIKFDEEIAQRLQAQMQAELEEEERYFSFGRHLDELHVTWAHLEKKRTRLRTNTKTLEDLCSQSLETTSLAIHLRRHNSSSDGVISFMTASARTDSMQIG